jgi:hypothetical protein
MSRFADLLKARVAKICIILDDMGNNATLVDAEMMRIWRKILKCRHGFVGSKCPLKYQ